MSQAVCPGKASFRLTRYVGHWIRLGYEIRPRLIVLLFLASIILLLQIQLLCQEFGDVIISPGFAGPFGKEADNWGRVYIPGATHGFAQARRQLLGWKDKIEHDPRYKWWPEKMRELDITPITVS